MEESNYSRPQLARLAPMQGWRLWAVIALLCLGLLLSALETTIIATALISIASSLGEYQRSNWIVVSYLLTYTGFLIIFARASDIFGRKSIFLISLGIFSISSLSCGISQTMNQLIVFRAFQGLGGAGIYSLAMRAITEIPSEKQMGPVAGLIGAVFATSSIVGPILGGAITSNTTWRWVFFLNIPAGFSLLGTAVLIFPNNAEPLPLSLDSLRLIDWPGSLLSLAASTLLVFALEQGGSVFSWHSAQILAPIVISCTCWISFSIWETFLSRRSEKKWTMLPIFPIRLATHRGIGFALLTALLIGFPFMTTIIFLPQRFQLANGLSPVAAGIRMLPLLLFSGIGSGLGGVLCSRKHIEKYLLSGSIAMQLVGLGLMTTLPISGKIDASQYGYQVLLGLGFGLSLSTIVIVARREVREEDLSVTMSSITQLRVLGGLIGTASSQSLLTRMLDFHLGAILLPTQLEALKRSAAALTHLGLSEAEIELVRQAYAKGFRSQTRMVLGIAGGCFLISLACWGEAKGTPSEVVAIDGNNVDKKGDEKTAEEGQATPLESLELVELDVTGRPEAHGRT